MSSETPELTPADHVQALRGVAQFIALVADYARSSLDDGASVDELVTHTATRGDGSGLELGIAALLYVANVVNLGPDDLLDLAADITTQLPNEGTEDGIGRQDGEAGNGESGGSEAG